ncbi:hypothetical protein SK128_024273 [Halocaridina rubra]|uniref:Apple domain-containing protein n=1 Tax=Halocaridina rubra TaxID=373956 RepID=A0AAN8WY54_HALRR
MQNFEHSSIFLRATGQRFTLSGSTLASVDISRTLCGSLCYQTAACTSFNYNVNDHKCELLNTASYKDPDPSLVSDASWHYYMFVPPNLNFDKNVLCPDGSVLLKYDQPLYDRYNPSLDGYTCTMNSWALDEYSAGRKDCRLVIQYDVDFPGYDTSYSNEPGTYYNALKQCHTNNCIGMICTRTGK